MVSTLFYFSVLSLYQKVSVKFSATDVQPNSECWLLIAFFFYKFLILYLKLIHLMKQ